MNKTRVINIAYLPTPQEIDGSKQLKAGGFLWPGFQHSYPVFAKSVSGGKYRYVTGLEINDQTPTDKKEEIEQVRKELEAEYGVGCLDPFNHDFWKTIEINVQKRETFLDITNNLQHKLLYYVIKGGGIFEIAKSYDNIDEDGTPKRFYMIEPEELADLSVQSDRTINKAIGKLEILEDEKSFMDMFLVHKVLVNADRGTTNQTPKSILYKDLSDFIHGKIVKTDKRKTPKQFVESFELLTEDKKKLFISAYIKDAIYYNFVITTEDNQFQNIETKTKYGGTLDKALEYLSNPANQYELDNVKERVEKKWSE